MLRILVHALAVFHLGPGIAFALLAFGCNGPALVLGDLCTVSPMRFFVLSTLVAWAILGALSALLLRGRPTQPASTA